MENPQIVMITSLPISSFSLLCTFAYRMEFRSRGFVNDLENDNLLVVYRQNLQFIRICKMDSISSCRFRAAHRFPS